MSPDIIEFLQKFDTATTTPLAATLTGLSLAAASLLTNLVKSYADKLPVLRDDMLKKQLAASGATDVVERSASNVLANAAATTYKDAQEVARQAITALRALLWAFAAFTINLLEALSLDVLIENPILKTTDQSREQILTGGLDYLTFLPIDVGISGVSLIVGISLLAYGANRMSAVIPKVS